MVVQVIKISDEERNLLSDFYGEDLGNEIDFNRLMPVVEKIEDELGLNTTIENAVVTIEGNLINEKGIDVAYYVKQIPYESQEETKITLVHKSVVEFIKWYNTNSHKR